MAPAAPDKKSRGTQRAPRKTTAQAGRQARLAAARPAAARAGLCRRHLLGRGRHQHRREPRRRLHRGQSAAHQQPRQPRHPHGDQARPGRNRDRHGHDPQHRRHRRRLLAELFGHRRHTRLQRRPALRRAHAGHRRHHGARLHRLQRPAHGHADPGPGHLGPDLEPGDRGLRRHLLAGDRPRRAERLRRARGRRPAAARRRPYGRRQQREPGRLLQHDRDRVGEPYAHGEDAGDAAARRHPGACQADPRGRRTCSIARGCWCRCATMPPRGPATRTRSPSGCTSAPDRDQTEPRRGE